MYVGVQGRLVRPQPIDDGVSRGLMTALCGRYPCLRPIVVGRSVLGREIVALVLGEGDDTQVLMASAFHGPEWITTLCALRLCEEMCSHLRADLPLCGVSLTRALQDPEKRAQMRRRMETGTDFENISLLVGFENIYPTSLHKAGNAQWEAMSVDKIAAAQGKDRRRPSESRDPARSPASVESESFVRYRNGR